MKLIYEICYLPWENNCENKPWLYSGSDSYSNDSYFGSLSSKLKLKCLNGMTIAEWWKTELKNNPQNFEKRTLLSVGDHITRQELQSLESAIQKKEDHRGSDKYFNRTNKHFNSPHISSSPLKGLTYEEIYGKETASHLKETRANAMRKARYQEKMKGYRRKRSSPVKNKTYEEIYGEERAAKLKKERSESSKKAREKDSHLINKRLLDSGKHVSQQKINCENCGLLVDKANYSRWHGPKCKR